MIDYSRSDALSNLYTILVPDRSQLCNQTVLKPYPLYITQLKYYPTENPILIAIDKNCSDFIRRLNGICLLCEKSNEHYELSFCYQREVWVLYSCQDNLLDAMNFAYAIVKVGGIKIYVILVRL